MGCGASVESPGAPMDGNPAPGKPLPEQTLDQIGSQAPLVKGAGDDCHLALRWQFLPEQPKVDLDACAIAFNVDGLLLDAAFFNNLVAVNGAITHHGDSLDGAQEGDDEVISIDMDALPMQGVCTVALCVFAHSGGTLTDVDSIVAFVRTRGSGDQWRNTARIPLTGISSMMGITGKSWKVIRLGHTIHGARNFQDAKDDIREACFSAGIVAPAPVTGPVLNGDVVFHMKKGDSCTVAHNHVLVGLGWAILEGSPSIDLDASCIMLGGPSSTGYRSVHDVVWHNDTQAPGVVHSGDNRTGVGDGDDEMITIHLNNIASFVSRIVITINSYNGTFKSVKNAHARVVDPQGRREMARYDLTGLETQAVVLCSFDRMPNGQWAFRAIGNGCQGRTAKAGECVDAVRGRPLRPITQLQMGMSVFLPPNMYDDSEDEIRIIDEWGCRGEWIWLDATVLVFDKDGRKIGEIDFNDNKWPNGQSIVTHSGDRQDEAKKHGSHEIRIKMQQLTLAQPQAFSLLLVISAYTQDLTFAVKPFVSLQDNDCAEVARFEPDTNFHATSIQMIDIHRHANGWMLSAHGILGEGKANVYGPIVQAYQPILQQIVDAGSMSGAPEFDYSSLPQDYKRGPAIS